MSTPQYVKVNPFICTPGKNYTLILKTWFHDACLEENITWLLAPVLHCKTRFFTIFYKQLL